MSRTRIVLVDVKVDVSADRCLEVELPPIRSRDRMRAILGECLVDDGWEKDGRHIRSVDWDVTVTYDPEQGEVEVQVREELDTRIPVRIDEDIPTTPSIDARRKDLTDVTEEAVSRRIEEEIGVVRRRFREKYVPEALARAVVERAQELDPAARVTRSEDDNQLVVNVELEVAG